jgi:hypothetical protein
MILDWDRQKGKSIYSINCILNYAINHPKSNNLIIGYNKKSSEDLRMKLLTFNFDKLQPILMKNTKTKTELINGSVIYYSINENNHYNTILIDEIEYLNLKYHGELRYYGMEYFFNILSHSIIDGAMVLTNTTDYNNNNTSIKMFNETLHKLNITINTDYFKTDDEISYILRRKKIEKIKTFILK